MLDAVQLEFIKQFVYDQSKKENQSIDSIQDSITQFCVQATATVEKLSKDYKKEVGRFNHVTPTLYLNLIGVFLQILQSSFNKINIYKT